MMKGSLRRPKLRIWLSALMLVTTLTLILAYSSVAGLVNRGEAAISLVATFILFPLSGAVTLNVDAQLEEQRKRLSDKISSVATNDSLPIPAEIHQVRLGGLEMRPTWTEARQSCLDLHPHWTFRLWEDKEADAFVAKYYPDLFETYRGYPLEIQRSNVLRYLLLDTFGGVYLDLDLKCLEPLDFVRSEYFVTPPANPTGVNNAFIASSRKHPFWTHLVGSLKRYDMSWFGSPYITNMFSTGCHFFSTMHRTFRQHIWGQRDDGVMASMVVLEAKHKLNGHVVTPLFEHLGASSWHKSDASMVLRIGRGVEWLKSHVAFVLVFALIFAALGMVGSFAWALKTKRKRACDRSRLATSKDQEQGLMEERQHL